MISIIRKRRYIDLLIAYKIYIDDIYYGKIRANQTKEFAVEHGGHTIHASTGKYRSNALRIDVNDSIVELEIGNALTGWKRLFWPYIDFLVEEDEYLFVRKKEA